MKRVILEDLAQNHIQEHFISEPKLVKKIFDLISAIQKNPFEGIGKPEAPLNMIFKVIGHEG